MTAEIGESDIGPGHAVTLRDVASLAGVHVSTVSRVLNGDPRGDVRPETSARIRECAQQLGYSPNLSARNLRLQRSGAFGLLIPDITHPTYASLARGALSAADSAGVAILLAELAPNESTTGYERLITERRIDGMIMATDTPTDHFRRLLDDRRIPAVYVNRRSAHGPSITVDDEGGAALAARVMIENGHRRLGIITGPLDIDTAERRLLAFQDEMTRHGLPAPAVADGSFTAPGGADAMSRLLASARPPSAVFASNLLSGIGALSQAHSRGIRIPQDLSLVVFDDADIADFTTPSLTRIRMPLAEMGAQAVHRLVDLLAGEPVADHVVDIPPTLVTGGSLAPPGGPTG